MFCAVRSEIVALDAAERKVASMGADSSCSGRWLGMLVQFELVHLRDALQGCVGLEHLAQRVQALHLAIVADIIGGETGNSTQKCHRSDFIVS